MLDFMLTMNHMTMCMSKGSLVVTNCRRISTQLCSSPQLFVLFCFFRATTEMFWLIFAALLSIISRLGQLKAHCTLPDQCQNADEVSD